MKTLVTGAGGFLGAALTRRLLARGDTVVALARRDCPELAAAGARIVQGDIAETGVVQRAVQGCDVVFHAAAKAGAWGRYADYHRSNVVGTRQVIRACLSAGVPRLVHTSTPSVVHSGRAIEGGDESLPYATHYESPYPATKAVAEQLVLGANGADLATVALRPHLMWGPGDTQLVPRLLERARAGRLRLVGDGGNLVDCLYIDNAVDAHLAAADGLAPGAACAGRPYFLSQGDPRPIGQLINAILAAGGLPPVTSGIPLRAALALGLACETTWRWRPRPDGAEPLMTRFVAHQLATAHWFDISGARRDLSYAPRVPIEEGMASLGAFLKRNDHVPGTH